MPESLIPRIVSTALLCSIMVAPFASCGKKVTSSTGETASTGKSKSAAPVEEITPDTMATFPNEGTAGSTTEVAREPVEAAREPMESAPPMSRPGGGTESAPPAGLSASGGTAVETLNLADIFFDYDQHTIRLDAQSVLSANAAWLNSRPGKIVVIEGHCDERGSQAYNLVLGDKRARSVKRYLEDLGVSASRLKTTSYGELRPFCKARDESCYQLNRRAHFVAQ